jgi:hypothetical protein
MWWYWRKSTDHGGQKDTEGDRGPTMSPVVSCASPFDAPSITATRQDTSNDLYQGGTTPLQNVSRHLWAREYSIIFRSAIYHTHSLKFLFLWASRCGQAASWAGLECIDSQTHGSEERPYYLLPPSDHPRGVCACVV